MGGRDLPEEFTFKTFSDWIRHALEEELERSWEIEMNGVGYQKPTHRPRAEPARGLGYASPEPQLPPLAAV